MTTKELETKIQRIAELCNETDEQQAVKAVLYSLLGAMAVREQLALMRVTADFSANQINRLSATFN